MTQVNIGVVGVGALALRGILPHLTQEDVRERVRVRGLCDPVLERAQATAEQYEIDSAYATLDELLADETVDAVTVASPIGLHYEHCRRSLEAGKHVHVNKTMCTTVEEADALIELATTSDLRLVASPGEVLRPQLRRTRELIEEGAIGELSWAICGGSFEIYHEQDEPERLDAPGGQAINPAWYFRKPGGGPMYDITVYALHQLTSVLGPARRRPVRLGAPFTGRLEPISDGLLVVLDVDDDRRLVHHAVLDTFQPVVEELDLIGAAFLGVECVHVAAGVNAQLLVLGRCAREGLGVAAQMQRHARPVTGGEHGHRNIVPLRLRTA